MSSSKLETAEQFVQSEIVARSADFAELGPLRKAAEASPLNCLLNVTVNVTAELGRTTLSIGDILKSGPGSVLELNRSISEPVDLMVQGVRFASGEVVVVDDHFAIRIKELAEPKKKT
jgi:flagellar motor switch protein FliN/FliY